MNLLETEAISINDEDCLYFNEYGTVKKVCELLNELYEKNLRLSKDKQLAETALMEYKEKVKNELELRYCLSNHKPVYQFMAEKLDITLEGIYDD